MRRIFSTVRCCLFLPLLIGTAHADDAPWQATFTEWQSLRDPDGGAAPFAQGARFLGQHPEWPDLKTIQLRTEAAALAERPDAATMERFCREHPPLSGRGMIACYEARAGDPGSEEGWLHQGWRQGDFSPAEEAQIANRDGANLTRADHAARLDRLLYENKPAPARRMYALLPPAVQPEAEARLAIQSDARDARARLKKLSPAEQRSPGILFARIGWNMRHHKEEDLAPLFLMAPKEVPCPDLWWPARALAAREALASRQPAQALAVVAGHGALKPEALAEALWLKGWITMQYRRDAATAYQDFYRLYTEVATPVSKARAAYWAGRAAAKNGNADIARQWYEKAARRSTVFYGQLAALALNRDTRLELPAPPRTSASEKKTFDNEDLVVVARGLDAAGDSKMRDLFVTHLAAQADTPARFALIAALAQELGGLANRVRVAKQALRAGAVLTEDGWPIVTVPPNLPIEPALSLSIARQESEFDPMAQSGAGARGLMQLLPATARHVADRNLLPYGSDTLFNPPENLTLGSIYLGQIVNGFGGSYVLGIASYNAGPGSVRKWIAQYGPPPHDTAGAVDWIESIPFAETRNYVMRVMENLQVYRARLGDTRPLQLERDLDR